MSRYRLQILAAIAVLLTATAAWADRNPRYRVTITNITKGQTFTPILVATHSRSVGLFELGSSASPQLEVLAEDGDTGPLTELLSGLGRKVAQVETIPGLLGPGESSMIEVETSRRASRLSAAAMLIPTNDTFFALDTVSLPRSGSRTHFAKAYDAGTEENDQNCDNIPGPRCGGEGLSEKPADGDEGSVYIGNGFHELGFGDEETGEILGPLTYDWRNPVARIIVKRLY